MTFMIEATEAERKKAKALRDELADCLVLYDTWEPSSPNRQRLRGITEDLVRAARAMGWDGHTDVVDWARERVGQ